MEPLVKWAGVWLSTLACLGCDPGRFDPRGEPERGTDSAIDDAGSLDAQTPRDGALDAQASNDAPDDALVGLPESGTDGATTDGATPASCLEPPPPPGGRPLRVQPGSARVIARVANAPGLRTRFVRAVQPQGDGLLWTLVNTPQGSTQADGGVDQRASYASVARSASTGPWGAADAPAAPVDLTLRERLTGGRPERLVPEPLAPQLPFELDALGLVVRNDEALLYLKQFYYFASTGMYLGRLGKDDFVLSQAPAPLFFVKEDQPVLGTAAFQHQGRVYAFGCEVTGPNVVPAYPCVMGRAPLASLGENSTYETYQDPAQGYTRALNQAAPVLAGIGETISLSFNQFLGRWLLVSSARTGETDEGSALLRTASAPEGPWSEPLEVPLPPGKQGLKLRLVVEQPALTGACGQRLVLSFFDPSEPLVYGGPPAIGQAGLLTLELQ